MHVRKLLTCTIFLAFLPPPSTPAAPIDFTVIAAAGSSSPRFASRLVVIDSTGAGEFCETAPEDRGTGDCTTRNPVALSPAQLDSLWAAVLAHDFFNLAPTHLDTTLADGTYAHLIVTANATTHQVMTHNTAVPGFDDIVIVLNSFLPAANRLIYNAIRP